MASPIHSSPMAARSCDPRSPFRAHVDDEDVDIEVADTERQLSGEEARAQFSKRRTNTLKLASPTELIFRDLGYAVKQRKRGKDGAGTKQILQGISGVALGRRMLAVVGGSGAGKTTFLDVLTLKSRRDGFSQGTVDLNGLRLTKQRFLQSAAYVQQESVLWGTLTARETLTACAELYGTGLTPELRKELVHDVLVQTGLMSCADTLAGDLLHKGLSGGQKKRLCVAEALVKRPALIVLDEPTSALDSSAAVEVMKVLKKLAMDNNILVVCTIHQPSQRIFSLFDNVIVLAEGRAAYVGPIAMAEAHMKTLNLPALEPGVSLCEYLLDLTNPDFTDKTQVHHILDAWSCVQQPGLGRCTTAVPEAKLRPFCAQVWVLLRRMVLMATRDPLMFGARWLSTCVACCVFAAIYYKARDKVQNQVLERLQLLNWATGAPAFMSVVVIAMIASELLILKKEVSNGMYNASAFVFAQALIAIPAAAVLSCCALLPLFLIVGYAWSAFPQMVFAHMVVMVWADSLGQVLAVCLPHYLLSMAAYIMAMFLMFLLSGVIINLTYVSWCFRWLAYVNPWRFCLRSMIWSDFIETTFEGFSPDCKEFGGVCFGTEGSDVLNSVGLIFYDGISSDDTFITDVGVSIGIVLVLKLVHYTVVSYSCR